VAKGRVIDALNLINWLTENLIFLFKRIFTKRNY